MCLLGKMWFNPLFRKAVFQLGKNAEILFLAFTYCLYGVRGQASVILLCGSQNGIRGFRLGRKCCQPLWLQRWGVPPWQSLLCCWGRQVGWEGTWNTPSPFGQRNLGEKEDRPGLLTFLSVFFIYCQETSILQCGSVLLYGAEQFWTPARRESQERGCVDSEQSIANVSGLIQSTEDALEKAWAPYSVSEKLTDNAPVSEEPAQAHCQQQALCSRKQESQATRHCPPVWDQGMGES